MTAGLIPSNDDSPRGAAPSSRAVPQAQARLLRLLADHLPAPIAYYSVDEFRCRFASRQYAQTFGHDEQSIVGCTMDAVPSCPRASREPIAAGSTQLDASIPGFGRRSWRARC